jgi:hypothetical protein
MKTVAWRREHSMDSVSESESKRGRIETSSKSPGLEIGTMESATEAGMIDPASDPAAAESASLSVERMSPEIGRVAV